jgi:CBS domain-containing protein
MQAHEIMTTTPVFCTPTDPIRKAAQLMADRHIGMVPVVENAQNGRLVGVLTDRDITCRVVAQGRDCQHTPIQEAMSTGKLWTVSPFDEMDTVVDRMEQGQVRRIPVVEADGRLVGVIATADIAREITDKGEVAEIFEHISAPTNIPHA